MRLVLDLQACQTESRFRGIGRYVDSLAHAILAERGSGPDTRVALDGTYPGEAERVRASLRDWLPAENFSSYRYPQPAMPYGDPADPRREIASHLIARHYAAFQPDAVLHGSLFEGYIEPAVTCERMPDIPGAVAAAIAYDVIPLIYPRQYFAPTGLRTWYERKLQTLRNCDLLLAISDATRRDLIERLGVSPERVAVIYAGLAPQFRHMGLSRPALTPMLNRFGIHRKYVLYTGNSDFRKNTDGALAAFARLPSGLRRDYQLVLNQADNGSLPDKLAGLGLAEDDVILTGHVSDADLASLMNGCDVFLFPSLYEGFGLPVLEAMACGAPVIAGNNSSIPELIENPEARFDASDPAAISAHLQRALTDADFCRSLREQGLQRASSFSWERSGRLALDAIEHAVERKRASFRHLPGPRRRLAMFTPLPPERTGIANYSAELMPALARYFQIDLYTTVEATSDIALAANFRIRPWQAFEAHANEYYGLVYQFGNSPFHSHMVDLLEKYPGIVVLHDFFLSSVFWYMDRHGGKPGAFAAELAYCHGVGALRDLAGSDGDSICRQRYPCNKRIIERSLGVLAHSPRVNTLLARYGMQRVAKTIRVINQQCGVPTDSDLATRNAIRTSFGFQPDDWLICSFGFLADTKLNDHVVQALAESGLCRDSRIHLVFVGELDGGDYGRQLRALISTSGMSDRIHVTGFVDGDTYQKYMKIADVALQLRKQSRGETSRAVIECMAQGIPVVVNAHGTMNDHPESVLVRLAECADPAEIAAALLRLRDDPGLCKTLGQAARAYVTETHSPTRVAEDHAVAIVEMIQRQSYLDRHSLARDVATALVDSTDAVDIAGQMAGHLPCSKSEVRTPALILDLSEVVHTDYGTGIHRVVRNLTRELIGLNGSGGYHCVPACLESDAYVVAADYALERLGVAGVPDRGRVTFAPGDALLFLDSAWSEPERFLPVVRAAEEHDVEIVGYVYDLIPLLHPDMCVPEMPGTFRHWLEHTVRTSHSIICISRATADDLITFITDNHLQHRRGLRIHYAHLGCDLEGAATHSPSHETLAAFSDGCRPTFLTVGTLEPRKGHADVLDAAEQLWHAGADIAVYLVGKLGWKMDHFAERLHSHREFGKRLFWQERASDADLDYAYRHSAGLIQASYAEGFGLPLLEAAKYGTPIVCSDIPVFREVAGDAAKYFPVGSAEGLARVLRDMLAEPEVLKHAAPPTPRTWRDAALDVMHVLGANPAYCTLG